MHLSDVQTILVTMSERISEIVLKGAIPPKEKTDVGKK